MTEVPKPLDTALDLLVYLPVGLAVTAAEELPKVAAKGRLRVNSQVAVARVVGRFAVSRGRQELERRFTPAAPGIRPEPPAGPHSSGPYSNGSGEPPRVNGSATPVTERVGGMASTTDGTGARRQAPAVPAGPVPEASELAIPGYDSLSASQVVQRLAGLAQDELKAVAAYEETHRGRRTILNRVEQLRAE